MRYCTRIKYDLPKGKCLYVQTALNPQNLSVVSKPHATLISVSLLFKLSKYANDTMPSNISSTVSCNYITNHHAKSCDGTQK